MAVAAMKCIITPAVTTHDISVRNIFTLNHSEILNVDLLFAFYDLFADISFCFTYVAVATATHAC